MATIRDGSSDLTPTPEYIEFEGLRGNLLESMKYQYTQNDPCYPWTSRSSNDLGKMRGVIAEEYRLFDPHNLDWIERTKQTPEEEDFMQEQEQTEREVMELEVLKEDEYYARLLEELASSNVSENASDEEGDTDDDLGDPENVSEKAFMEGFAYEPDDSDGIDTSPLEESVTESDEEQDPPIFTAQDWRRGRDLLWKMRTLHPQEPQILAMEAEWLRLALMSQDHLHVFYTKAAFGKAMLREIEMQSYVDASGN